MPKVQTTSIFSRIQNAKDKGYTTVSEQGSSRSGKTFNTVLWLCVYAMQRPGTTISVVRQTLPALKRSVYRDFVDNMYNLGAWDDKCMNRSEFIYSFPNGSWIEFFSADNEQKLRGSKRKILYVNEGNELKFIEWQQLQMRTTDFSIIDYNPSFSDDHWLCDLNKDPRTFHFITTYKENPFLEQKVIDEIESLQWKNPSLWRVYGLGLQAIIEGLIFENVEYIEEIPRWAKKHRYLGMDLGYTNDPTAITEVCVTGDAIYINEVCYQTKMLASDIIDTIKAYIREEKYNFEVISESADPRMIDEVYNAGIDIKAVHKYAGSIMAGITKMLEMKIYVTKRSTNAIKEFKNYTYRQDKEGKWLNEPIDAFNHCFTGDTMVRTVKGNKRIDSIKEGELVATSIGYRPVGKLFIYRCQKICKYRLFFDKFAVEISATPNHYIKTAKGWTQIQNLQAGDHLFLFSISTVKPITSTTESDTIQEEQFVCTSQCGDSITEQYPKAITYTTKMGILRTIRSKILNWCRRMNILKCTQQSSQKMKNYPKEEKKTWIEYVLLQKPGTHQKKADCGILSMLKASFFHWLFALVNNVVKSMKPENQKALGSAPIIANQSTEETLELITRDESAPNVDANLQQTSIQEVSFAAVHVLRNITVLEESEADVYDLHVDGIHEYFANDILVHNCIDSIRYVCLEKVLGGYGTGMDAEDFAELL